MQNNYQLIQGFLSKDPETGTYGEGKTFARLSIPTTERYKDHTGEYVDGETTWHTIVVYRPYLVKRCGYLRKGSLVIVEGSLSIKSYEDKDGIQRKNISTIASDIKELVHRRSS